MVTGVPGRGTCAGVNEVMVGAGATKVSALGSVALPPAVVTFTVTAPATWASVMAFTWVGLVTVKLETGVVVWPNATLVAPRTRYR